MDQQVDDVKAVQPQVRDVVERVGDRAQPAVAVDLQGVVPVGAVDDRVAGGVDAAATGRYKCGRSFAERQRTVPGH